MNFTLKKRSLFFFFIASFCVAVNVAKSQNSSSEVYKKIDKSFFYPEGFDFYGSSQFQNKAYVFGIAICINSIGKVDTVIFTNQSKELDGIIAIRKLRTKVGGSGGVGRKQQMIPEEEVLDLAEPSSIDDGKDSEIEEVVGLDTFKVAPVKCKFFNALPFYAQSKERIVVKVNNGNRVITDIHHDGHRLIGEIPGVKITVQQPLFTPYHGDHNAVMEVDYTMHCEGKGALSWLDSHMLDVYSVGQWNEYFQKIN